MANDIKVADAQFRARQSVETSEKRREQQRWVELAVTIRNSSTNTTYHVVSTLRTLRYDVDTRTLVVGLSETESVSNVPLRHVFPAGMTPVEPGETANIEISVPVPMREVRLSKGSIEVEEVDVSGLQRVTVIISYDHTPYRPVYTDSPVERIKQLHNWGRRTQATFSRMLPA